MKPLAQFMFALCACLFVGCLPYAVGTTAATVAPRQMTRTVMFTGSRQMVSLAGDVELLNVDVELRTGINERSDAGIRITSASGLVGSYNRRLVGDGIDAGLSAQGELGVLGMGGAAEAGVTVIASGRESDFFTPYGGVRVLATAPLQRDYHARAPAFGFFAGGRVGSDAMGISPEFAFFRDRLQRDYQVRYGWLFVPSVTLQMGSIFNGFPVPWGRHGTR